MGFTIVELLVVISIIALLVGILVPAVQKARDSAKVTQSKSNIHQVMVALANYATDHNDRNYSAAPDGLASGSRKGMDCDEAIMDYQGPMSGGNTPLGLELGTYGESGGMYAFYMAMFSNGGDESGGVVPYCFDESNSKTFSTTGKVGFGVWRYPNAGQVATYMGGDPLHAGYFAPKDIIPARALEGCDDIPATYCPSTNMASFNSLLSANDGLWTSELLQAPSSYCISPALMYNPAAYQWDMRSGSFPIDPMDISRGFKPPSTDQAKYPGHKTWLMEHNWLQNVDNNECGINWDPMYGSWFQQGDGTWDGCEPEHFNSGRKSEPVTVMIDGSTTMFSVMDAVSDSNRVKADDPYNNQGLWLQSPGGYMGNDGYWAGYATDWAQWSGHTHTMNGIRGQDRLATK